MNSFALLQDDVEDADDLSPAPKLVAPPEQEPAPVAPKPVEPLVAKKPAQAADRAQGRWREGDFHAPGEYRGRGRGRGRGFRGRGRGGYRGRGRGGGAGFYGSGGTGGATSGGGYNRFEREAPAYGDSGRSERDGNRFDRDAPRQDRERRDGGWESRDNNVVTKSFEPNGALVEQVAPAAPVPEIVASPIEDAPVESKTEVRSESEANSNDGKENVKDSSDTPVEAVEEKVKEMTLDEYMAEKKAKALEMRALSSKSSRKVNNGKLGVGGKMAVLKKKGAEIESTDETSIMSAVSIKRAVEERAVKDSTHAAVADNAKNQQFFKNSASHRGRGYGNGDYRRSYQGDDGNRGQFGGRGGRGRGGFRGGFRGGNRGGYGRRNEDEGNRRYGEVSNDSRNRSSYSAASSQINVDDKNAFPSLNTKA